MIVELRGGSQDGLRLLTSLWEDFIWVKGVRCYRQRRKGAEPYRRAWHSTIPARVSFRVDSVPVEQPPVHMFDFIGHTHSLCLGCEATHWNFYALAWSSRCELCGGRLVKLSDLR